MFTFVLVGTAIGAGLQSGLIEDEWQDVLPSEGAHTQAEAPHEALVNLSNEEEPVCHNCSKHENHTVQVTLPDGHPYHHVYYDVEPLTRPSFGVSLNGSRQDIPLICSNGLPVNKECSTGAPVVLSVYSPFNGSYVNITDAGSLMWEDNPEDDGYGEFLGAPNIEAPTIESSCSDNQTLQGMGLSKCGSGRFIQFNDTENDRAIYVNQTGHPLFPNLPVGDIGITDASGDTGIFAIIASQVEVPDVPAPLCSDDAGLQGLGLSACHSERFVQFNGTEDGTAIYVNQSGNPLLPGLPFGDVGIADESGDQGVFGFVAGQVTVPDLSGPYCSDNSTLQGLGLSKCGSGRFIQFNDTENDRAIYVNQTGHPLFPNLPVGDIGITDASGDTGIFAIIASQLDVPDVTGPYCSDEATFQLIGLPACGKDRLIQLNTTGGSYLYVKGDGSEIGQGTEAEGDQPFQPPANPGDTPYPEAPEISCQNITDVNGCGDFTIDYNNSAERDTDFRFDFEVWKNDTFSSTFEPLGLDGSTADTTEFPGVVLDTPRPRVQVWVNVSKDGVAAQRNLTSSVNLLGVETARGTGEYEWVFNKNHFANPPGGDYAITLHAEGENGKETVAGPFIVTVKDIARTSYAWASDPVGTAWHNITNPPELNLTCHVYDDGTCTTWYSVGEATGPSPTPSTGSPFLQHDGSNLTAANAFPDDPDERRIHFFSVDGEDNKEPLRNITVPRVDVTAPSVTSPQATTFNESTLNLSWAGEDATSGIVQYQIYRNTTPEFDLEPANLTATTSQSTYNDTGLAKDTRYYYRVVAMDAANNTGASTEFSGSTEVLLVGVNVNRTSLMVSEDGPSSDRYLVTLTQPPDGVVVIDVASAADEVQVSPAQLTFDGSSFDSGLEVQVTAVDDAEEEGTHADTITHVVNDTLTTDGNYSSTLAVPSVQATIQDNDDATPPDEVPDVTATALNHSTLQITWSPAMDNEGGHGVSHYEVYVNETEAPTATAGNLTNAFVNGLQHTLTDLTTSTEYHIGIRAVDAAGNNGPLNVSASATTSPELVLSSEDLTLDEGMSETYSVRLSHSPAGETVVFDLSATSANVSLQDPGGNEIEQVALDQSNWDSGAAVTVVSPGDDTRRPNEVLSIEHEWNQSASSAGATPVDSSILEVTVVDDDSAPPGPMENLDASGVGSRWINFTWEDQQAEAVTEYRVYLSTHPFMVGEFPPNATTPASKTWFNTSVLGPLTPDTEYHFNVTGVNGTTEGDQGPGKAIMTLPDTEPPGAVEHLFAVAEGHTAINVSWSPPSIHEDDLGGYRIYWNESSFQVEGHNFLFADAQASSLVISGLEAGSTYHFNVTAVDDSGNEGPPNLAGVTASTLPPPRAVSSLAASQGMDWVNATWTDDDNEPGNVTHYHVYMADGPFNLSDGDVDQMVVPAGTQYFNATGLAPDTSYYFNVTAVNSTGSDDIEGPALSPGLTAVTDPDSESPGTPDVQMHSKGETWINVTWTGPMDPDLAGFLVSLNGTEVDNRSASQHYGFNFTGLAEGATYSLSVTAYDESFNHGAPGVLEETTRPRALQALVDSGPLTVMEDESVGFTVRLNRSPGAGNEVVLDHEGIACQDGGDPFSDCMGSAEYTWFTISPARVILTPGNWDTGVNITVTAQNDHVADGGRLGAIIETFNETESVGPISVEEADILNLERIDDDAPGIWVSKHHLNVTETGSMASFSVRLTSRPIDNVTLTLEQERAWTEFVEPEYLEAYDEAKSDVNEQRSILDDVLNDSNATEAEREAAWADHNSTVRDILAEFFADVDEGVGWPDREHPDLGRTALTFGPGNWSMQQIVTVTGVDDPVALGNHTSWIELDVDEDGSSSDYLSVASETVEVNNMEDDLPGLVVQETNGTTVVHENGTHDNLTVTLASQPIESVTVEVMSTNDTEMIATPSRLVFGPGNWSTPKEINVTGVDDSAVDGNVSSYVRLQILTVDSSIEYALVPSQAVEVVAVDDEEVPVPPMDTDGDGISDADEEEAGTDKEDPLDPEWRPSNVTISLRNGNVNVTWQSPQHPELDRFIVWRFSEPTQVASIPFDPDQSSYYFEQELEGSVHRYSVQAVLSHQDPAFNETAASRPALVMARDALEILCPDGSLDSDEDGLCDAFEEAAGTDPDATDSDGDGFDDHAEILASSDPMYADSAPLQHAAKEAWFKEPFLWVGIFLVAAILALGGIGIVAYQRGRRPTEAREARP